jgi:hypothetical protein
VLRTRRPVCDGLVLFGDAPHPSLSLRAALRAFYDAGRRSQGEMWRIALFERKLPHGRGNGSKASSQEIRKASRARAPDSPMSAEHKEV